MTRCLHDSFVTAGDERSGFPEMITTDFTLLTGNANRLLAERIADLLGVAVSAASVTRFPDGEVTVDLHEPVRRKDVFIVQPTAPPVNDHLMELLACADACRRASAASVTAVMPYFGYARADKRHGRREPITASMVATLLQAVGVTRVMTLDLHASQIEGFFQIPVDSLTAVPVLCEAMRSRLPHGTVVVSPDAGRLPMATEYAQRLNASVVLLHKTRESGTTTHVTHLVGDVRDRPCLIVDDMIATGGTLADSIRTLLDAGARPGLFIAATHGPLLEDARRKLSTNAVAEIFVTDTVQHAEERAWPQLRIVSVAPVVASGIQRMTTNGSMRDLF